MPYLGPEVMLDAPAFIHDTVLVYGRVMLGRDVTVWPHAVFRAEMHEIRIGARSNIQDFVMVHVGYAHPTIVGEDCSIAHHATLHGCEIGDRCLVGIGATIMDGARIGDNSVVAGHSIVTEGTTFPPNSVIAGSPAKLIKHFDCASANLANAAFYRINGENYRQNRERLSDEDLAMLEIGMPR